MKRSVTVEVAEIGSISVGKTCLSRRFVNDIFSKEGFPTVGSGLLSKTVEIEDYVVTMNIWDTSGSERFRSLVPIYIKNASIALVVFDVASRKSFQEIDTWLEFAEEHGSDNLMLCLVGNKIDLPERDITEEEARDFAERKGILYFETSAKSGIGVDEVFSTMVKEYLAKHVIVNETCDPLEPELSDPINVGKSKKCC